MKVILVMVSSLNGKITKGRASNIYSWTSKEDSKLFFRLVEKHNLIVMGRKTYEAIRENIELRPDKLRIVLTKDPQKFASDTVPGSLEFSNESPAELLSRLQRIGYTEMLLVGGGEVNALFLKSSLVDELYLTIEPIIFGTGKTLVADEELDVSLKLIGVKKLNKKGTLHLRYRVRN
ncbi:MAG: dihydrofolate reductase [Candidatus Blackburnbacteria bacterium]|nr:dihydrofolate reductase [Candidatus Blackburnbacteria bacterium]